MSSSHQATGWHRTRKNCSSEPLQGSPQVRSPARGCAIDGLARSKTESIVPAQTGPSCESASFATGCHSGVVFSPGTSLTLQAGFPKPCGLSVYPVGTNGWTYFRAILDPVDVVVSNVSRRYWNQFQRNPAPGTSESRRSANMGRTRPAGGPPVRTKWSCRAWRRRWQPPPWPLPSSRRITASASFFTTSRGGTSRTPTSRSRFL